MPDLRTPEINEKRQSKTEQRNREETQTDFPEICHSSNDINKEEILSKYVKEEVDLFALTLIRVSFLGFCFEVGDRGDKITPPCLKLVRVTLET